MVSPSTAVGPSGLHLVAKNIVFGGLTKFWRALLHIIFTPVYIHLLGPESYGLVAFYTTMQLLLVFLDQAVSPPMIRELGRMGKAADHAKTMRRLLWSMQVVTLATALFLGLAVALLAPFLSNHWLQAEGLSHPDITLAIRLMGLNLAMQWPSLLFNSALIGLHRQSVITRVILTLSTVQSAGIALVLYFLPDIHLFFVWQALFTGLISLFLGLGAWRNMPLQGHPLRFDMALLRSKLKFATGTFCIGITATLLTQTDKLAVSKYVTLDEFAAYALAFSLTSQISLLAVAPFGQAIQPYLAGLMVHDDESRLKQEYHRWSQIHAFIAVTALGTFAFYARPLLTLWLGSESTLVEPLAGLVPWVVAGNILNSIMAMPFILQMAAGWVRLSLVKNIVALALFLPALFIFVPRYGMQVGAVLWFLLNLGYYVFEPLFLHRRYLRRELAAWWLGDTLMPGLLAVAVFWGLQRLIPSSDNPWIGLVQAALSALAVALVLIACLPRVRRTLGQGIAKMRRTTPKKDTST